MVQLRRVVLPRELWPRRDDWSGKIVELHVAVGDKVEVGTPLVDVEIEKAILTIESDVEGIVKNIFVSKGDEVSPGTTLLEIEV